MKGAIPSKRVLFAGATMLIGAVAGSTSAHAAVDNTIQEVIVTAQRRTEALESVPMSVSVVTAQTLSNAEVTNVRDLTNVTSGFQLGAGGAFPQPAIRGVTSLLNGTFENNVGVYVDGLYQPVATALNIPLPNMESVQLLKGPQGTLYGRNATGGALLLTTISPSTVWRGKGELTYAEYDDRRASGFIAGPLADNLGVSLAGYMRRTDGYAKKMDRVTPGVTHCCGLPIEQDSFRAKLKADLTHDLQATLAYSFMRVSDPSSNEYSPIYNVPASLAGLPGASTRPTKLGQVAYDFDEKLETKQHEIGLTVDLETSLGPIKSITGYSTVATENNLDFDGTYAPTNYIANTIKNRTFQQAIDYNITAIKSLDLLVGGNYFRDHLDFPKGSSIYAGLNPTGPGTSPGTLADYTLVQNGVFDQVKKAWALYVDATYHLTDKFSVTAGGRYSREDQRIEGATFSSIPSVARQLTSASETFSKFTPRLAVLYELAPRTNVYASYSQGFRSGAFNSTLPSCVNLTPVPADCIVPARQETVNAYEVGFKMARRAVRLDLAGFYYDYKDLQVAATRTLVVGGVATPVVDVQNAPKAKIYGIEASGDYQPFDALTIRASATWLHARYGSAFLFSGTGVNPAVPGVNVNSNPLLTYTNVSQVQDLSGLQMSRAPNFSAFVNADYTVPLEHGTLLFSGNVKYTSSYVITNPSVWGPLVDPAHQRQQRYVEGGYALVTASVTWSDAADHLYTRLWATNLTDHRYRLHWTGNYAPLAWPRQVGATVGYRF